MTDLEYTTRAYWEACQRLCNEPTTEWDKRARASAVLFDLMNHGPTEWLMLCAATQISRHALRGFNEWPQQPTEESKNGSNVFVLRCRDTGSAVVSGTV